MERDSDISRRYSRQFAVKEVGESGQRRLLESAVMIVGCGALGSMAAMQLAGAGVGRIGIADFDTIDISNLQRQFFFSTAEAGKSKASVLERRMQALNPGCRIERYDSVVTEKRALEIFPHYDFIIDATDNAASKMMTERVAMACGLPCCIGGVSGFRGQVQTVVPGRPGFAEVFSPEESGDVLPCAIEGVMGPAAAMCASLQASEAIKYIAGSVEESGGRLIVFDLLRDSFQSFEI